MRTPTEAENGKERWAGVCALADANCSPKSPYRHALQRGAVGRVVVRGTSSIPPKALPGFRGYLWRFWSGLRAGRDVFKGEEGSPEPLFGPVVVEGGDEGGKA